MTEHVESLDALCERFDAFLVDLFGVLLNGSGAYPFAPAALLELSRRRKQILLLSNSGKRSASNEARLERLGFSRDSYLCVLSSGEAAYAEIARRVGAGLRPGARVYPFDRRWSLAARRARRDALRVAGRRRSASDRGLPALGAVPRRLREPARRPAAEAGVPALCSNPDVKMMTGDQLMFAAGRVARLYEELGGAVEWFGKPHRAIYDEALRRLGGVERGRIVCIGDSPAHDISGAGAPVSPRRWSAPASMPENPKISCSRGAPRSARRPTSYCRR